ncbi:MAG: hypothetical protein OEZ01_02840 [Candidatus Heimdallarchaeota archaeon]|nr:hypothetical protein [Candidatus Heimdallarchaeota archaeon]MDH5644914.1 hypothetical protein [Candidatus Heimdallarchaeota archaeon]
MNIISKIETSLIDNTFYYNLISYFKHYNDPKNQYVELDNLFQFQSPLPYPDFNAILSQIQIVDEEVHLNNPTQLFNDLSLPYYWWVFKDLNSNELVNKIKEKKLRNTGDIIVLGAEIAKLVEIFSTPNSLFVEPVNNADKMKKWAEITSYRYNIKGTFVDTFLDNFKDVRFTEDTYWSKYIGWLNGEPVASSTLIKSQGIAAVYDVSIIPRYRNWGIENSMIMIPLRQAKRDGYHVGVTIATIGEVNRIKPLNFVELFKIQRYLGVPPRAKK